MDDADTRATVSHPTSHIPRPVVTLGPMTREMIPALCRWLNDPETTRALGDIRPPMMLGQVEAWYQRSASSPNIAGFSVYDADSGQLVGTTALLDIDHRNRTAEFGIIIGEPGARGRGVGTEVTRQMAAYGFSVLGLHSLWLTTYTFNIGGLRAYARAGYREVGRRRECYRYAGRAWDKVYMECLASEFPGPPAAELLPPTPPQ